MPSRAARLAVFVLFSAWSGCASERTVEDSIYASLANVQSAEDDSGAYADGAIEDGFAAKPPDLLLVLIGGHDSCKPGAQGQDMAPAFSKLRRTLQAQGIATSFFMSCYGALSYEAYTQRSHDRGRTTRVSNAQAQALIAVEARLTATKKVAIIGHSYGGWLALQTALGLPPDVTLVELTTIDPVSQRACVRHQLGARLISTIMGDDASAACQRFPDDVTTAERQRLAATAPWRLYFQKQTTQLRSGPTPEATSSTFIDTTHTDICIQPGIWQRLLEDLGGKPTEPLPAAGPERRVLDEAGIAAWIAGEKTAHPFTQLSETSVRLLLRYSKSTLSLYPEGTAHKVAVYEPNVRPSLGLAVNFTTNHGLGLARSLDFLKSSGNKVHTRAVQYEYRYTQRHWAADVFYHEYRGLFLERVRKGDATPFRDTLFRGIAADANRPDMTLRSFGVGGVWLYDPDAVSLSAMLSQKEQQLHDGWTPLIDGGYRQLSVRNAGGLIPADLQVAGAVDPTTLTARTLSLLPGLAGAVTSGDYFASATAAWGAAYRVVGNERAFAESGSVRLTLGRNAPGFFGGVTGQKRMTSADSKTLAGLGMSDAYSAVELFAGEHF